MIKDIKMFIIGLLIIVFTLSIMLTDKVFAMNLQEIEQYKGKQVIIVFESSFAVVGVIQEIIEIPQRSKTVTKVVFLMNDKSVKLLHTTNIYKIIEIKDNYEKEISVIRKDG